MKLAAIMALLLLIGCHNGIRVGSPQLQRAPDICVVILQSDDVELAKSAIDACKAAIDRRGMRL